MPVKAAIPLGLDKQQAPGCKGRTCKRRKVCVCLNGCVWVEAMAVPERGGGVNDLRRPTY